jgi:hypothetical protein
MASWRSPRRTSGPPINTPTVAPVANSAARPGLPRVVMAVRQSPPLLSQNRPRSQWVVASLPDFGNGIVLGGGNDSGVERNRVVDHVNMTRPWVTGRDR